MHVYEVATYKTDPEYKAKHILGCMSRAAKKTLAASLWPGLTWDQTVEILTQEFGSSQDICVLKTEFMSFRFKGSLDKFSERYYTLAQQITTSNNLDNDTAKATLLSAVYENKNLH